MNPKNILVAIEEKNKWVERKERLTKELKEVQAEKRRILRELFVVREEIARLDGALATLASKSYVSSSPAIDLASIK